MKFIEKHLTPESETRAAEIADAIEDHIYSHPEIFGHNPAPNGERGINLRRRCKDDTLNALYAEHDALPRHDVEVSYNDADMSSVDDFYNNRD